ncbi:hypothetical protein L596_011949 [Steinernema carpocapsae]|uniref:Uncharacterized protein n=1 Tax=Steinernema carpocapsae TaxID=34508 RepID=A0A4U5NWG3_STECR|nr:hypothetical protein L596_011949 [Steinernema carpocapsae]
MMAAIRESTDLERAQKNLAAAAVENVQKPVENLEKELELLEEALNEKNEEFFKREVGTELKKSKSLPHAAVVERERAMSEKLNATDGNAICTRECNDKSSCIEEQVNKSLAKREESTSGLKKKFSQLIDFGRNKLRKMEKSKPGAEAIALHEELSESVFDEVEGQLSLLNGQLDALQRLSDSLQAANEAEANRQAALTTQVANRREGIKIDDLRKEISALEKKHEEVVARLKQNHDEKLKIAKANEDAATDIEKLTKDAESLDAKIAELSDENKRLDDECSDLHKQKEALQKELGQFMSTANSQILAFERQQQEVALAKRNEMMKRREEMQQKVFDAQKECNKCEETLNKLKAQLFRRGVDPENTSLESVCKKIAVTKSSR